MRARGVGEAPFKCTTQDKGWTTRWFLNDRSALSYLGVYGGSKWETTFKAEAGREYFVEVAPGLRVNFQTEEAAMKHKLTTLKRTKRVNVFLSKSEAEQAVREVEQNCSENRLSDAFRATIKTVGPRAVD